MTPPPRLDDARILTCPSCRHVGPHQFNAAGKHFKCGACGWLFIVDREGRTRDRLDIYAAGRQRRP